MTSNREVAKHISGMANLDILARIAPGLEAVMTSEFMDKATAAMAVASLVGWFYVTLDPKWRFAFEQLIEVQFEFAQKYDGGM